MDVKERLQQLMDERGWTIYKVAKEAGIPWSTVRNMFKRMTLPQFFDVENEMGLTDEQRQLIHQWSKLNNRNKRLVSELVKALNEKA